MKYKKCKLIVAVYGLPFPSYAVSIAKKDFPELFGEFVDTDSFDHALSLVGKDEEDVIVLAGTGFNDDDSEHYQNDAIRTTFSIQEKTASALAREIKKKSPTALVYIYSNNQGYTEHLDGQILRRDPAKVKELFETLKKLKKIN